MAMSVRNEADDDSEDEGSIDPADALFERAVFLRKLREADEIERNAASIVGGKDNNVAGHPQTDAMDEGEHTLSNGQRILDYNAYLEHQRYYDDCKHIDYHYIDYGTLEGLKPSSSSPCCYPLIIEQDKSLGKGGLCWDAAFILGEFMGQTLAMAAPPANAVVPAMAQSTMSSMPTAPVLRMIELGAGTGICGLVVAKLLQQSAHPVECHVTLTDLPQLLPLLRRNVARNFDTAIMASNFLSLSAYCAGKQYLVPPVPNDCAPHDTSVLVTVSPLDWDNSDQKKSLQQGNDGRPWNVVFGADIVASLYDPISLAQTMAGLCTAQTVVYVGFKERLSTIHRQFESEMAAWFQDVTILRPPHNGCRNRNPDVYILTARGKRRDRLEGSAAVDINP
jgi:Lysine methyltransferase